MGSFKGGLDSAEFQIVRSVFKRVAAGASFKDDIPTLSRFGLIVLHAYQGGIVDADQLYRHCLESSRRL